MAGAVWFGLAGEVGHGKVRRGMVRCGAAGEAGEAGNGTVWLGWFGQGRQGMARQVAVGKVRYGAAGEVRPGMACPGGLRIGNVGCRRSGIGL